jgi:hypothetical protein
MEEGGAKEGPGRQRLFLTERDVARLIGYSVKTLQVLRVRGGGPRFYRLGSGPRGRIAYMQDDVEAWVRARPYATTRTPLASNCSEAA